MAQRAEPDETEAAAPAVDPQELPPRIEDYALIGDCTTAALVSRAGSIDWLCWPRFDSDACFAALLDSPRAGRWLIAPKDRAARVTRKYLPGTLILETTFETGAGAAMMIDFMPVGGSSSSVVRILRGLRGRLSMCLELTLRFNYGSVIPWVTRLRTGFGLRAVAGPSLVVLNSTVPVEGRGFTTVAEFDVEPGEETYFVLTHGPSHLPTPAVPDPDRALYATQSFWTDWCHRGTYEGEWKPAVQRSLLTLKALTFAETGGIVAAPTTSLPEQLGGTRNWDYRFCWLRDATFTLLALIHAGYREEARAWSEWLHRSVAGNPAQVQTLYGLAGERRLAEWEVPWLAGYQGSRPVRIGNAASEQLQIDVFGEVVDALYQAERGGLSPPGEAWELQREIVEHLITLWDQPDESIWEVRGGRQQFTFSKVMAWVALDRAVKGVEERKLTLDAADDWRKLRDDIHTTICRRGFNPARNSFVQSFDGDVLDASVLMIPLVGFLPATDPRMRGTVAAIERELVHGGLVRRYQTENTKDGLPPGEGVFLACSFWLADNFVLQGRYDDATALFRRLLALANDVGLLAEEYDPTTQRLVGNFPQAFSHLALINTALNLSDHGPAHQRGAHHVREKRVPEADRARASRAD
jgi:GH15 family glucan-1,4-alpha-glucosidase